MAGREQEGRDESQPDMRREAESSWKQGGSEIGAQGTPGMRGDTGGGMGSDYTSTERSGSERAAETGSTSRPEEDWSRGTDRPQGDDSMEDRNRGS